MPRPRKYNKSKKLQYKKKSQYKKNQYYKRNKYSGDMIVSRPLLPETQKVMMRYSTRIQIVPAQINSGYADTASNVSIHSIHWNNLFDPDYSTGSLDQMTRHNDGAWDHQPRMYDQYSAFYDRITCIGAKANLCFSANNRLLNNLLPTTTGSYKTSQIVDPKPMFVGYLNSNWYDTQNPVQKFDSLNEKKEIRYKRLLTQDKPQCLTAKWSINKEPTRRNNLVTKDGETKGDWGHGFAVNGPHTQNTRYLHMFVHPISLNEGTADGNAVQPPVDVQVDIEYIAILSDRKEVVQS